jgi:hypothetical protein
MRDRQREETSRYQAEIDAIANALEQQIGSSQDEIHRLENAELADSLATSELQRAAAKRPL